MPLPASANAIKRLGDRIGSGAPIRGDDSALLNEVIVAYAEPLTRVLQALHSLGYPATGRLKSRGTLVEKLIRDPKTKIPSIHDIAGARFTVDELRQQREAVGRVKADFDGRGWSTTVIDRRKDPRSGYRAVHLVTKCDGMFVEVQIRTTLQDLWAQVMERMGDHWGRDIRYGGSVAPCEDPVVTEHREFVVRHHMDISELIERLEDVSETIESARARVADIRSRTAQLEKEMREIRPAWWQIRERRRYARTWAEVNAAKRGLEVEITRQNSAQEDLLAMAQRISATLREQLQALEGGG